MTISETCPVFNIERFLLLKLEFKILIYQMNYRESSERYSNEIPSHYFLDGIVACW